MSEDLKYTKQELELCDSICAHQESIILLKDEALNIQRNDFQEKLSAEKKKKVKTGIFSGGICLLLGIILGLIL